MIKIVDEIKTIYQKSISISLYLVGLFCFGWILGELILDPILWLISMFTIICLVGGLFFQNIITQLSIEQFNKLNSSKSLMKYIEENKYDLVIEEKKLHFQVDVESLKRFLKVLK